MKIFFVASVGIVMFLSFFNEYRADNSGEDSSNSMTASSLLYFKNMRQYYYDIERNDETKIDIYRYRKRLKDENLLFFNISIIMNRIKDKAYIYIEPSPILLQLDQFTIRWKDSALKKDGVMNFRISDRFSHLKFVEELYALIHDGTEFEVRTGTNDWESILVSKKERYAFKVTAKDYFRLVEQNPK